MTGLEVGVYVVFRRFYVEGERMVALKTYVIYYSFFIMGGVGVIYIV